MDWPDRGMDRLSRLGNVRLGPAALQLAPLRASAAYVPGRRPAAASAHGHYCCAPLRGRCRAAKPAAIRDQMKSLPCRRAFIPEAGGANVQFLADDLGPPAVEDAPPPALGARG